MQQNPGEGGEGVRSVLRALDLLALFDETHRSRTVRELIDATGLPKSTVVRLVATLEQRGLLWTRGDGRLAPGAGMLRWAQLAQDAWQLPAEAVECLRNLSEESGGESSRIYIRQGVSRLCVAQHEGTQQLRHVVRIGEAMPLWAGASGHVLLAGSSPEDLRGVAAAAGRGSDFEPVLAERVRHAEEQGWAVSHGEREDGVSAVAAPVTDSSGRAAAAVGLGGPTSRFTRERVEAFIPVVMNVAKQLSKLQFIGGRS
ncbi:DNA-binding transcriptional regulator, IclR family [Saccharopolyspora antimicrobica]|uniref:DNA-binding transcriptional regulator, IclR family n=1 Tax=Saccharopolyspora antimicrobica TaxID=455193 RepID=A0A1I5GT18_9PSEU|nr:IclR family transcriptional regulator [Saccharopolyspora antimicrobica]RKT87384.1 IclR family transcriptional regulator [Saccharopolyspora antimicrobica]SFO38721.1 DNA-binding transcriptional regulator, IclR family [Saccharopolyspora antimicrobica]